MRNLASSGNSKAENCGIERFQVQQRRPKQELPPEEQFGGSRAYKDSGARTQIGFHPAQAAKNRARERARFMALSSGPCGFAVLLSVDDQ